MRPKSVLIDKQELSDPAAFRHEARNSLHRNGHPGGESPADTIEVHFDSARRPSALGFELATNGNGALKTFSGEVRLQNATGSETYQISFENAFVESYELVSPPDPNQPAYDHWVLRSPRVTYYVDGKPEERDLAWAAGWFRL